jgi:hypothetical protein
VRAADSVQRGRHPAAPPAGATASVEGSRDGAGPPAPYAGAAAAAGLAPPAHPGSQASAPAPEAQAQSPEPTKSE